MTFEPPAAGAESSAPRSASSSFPIVGIGASAGGLEAFSQLLRHLPADSGMAYVLVQHLDPKHESRLADLLAKTTHMPVLEVADRGTVRPDHVYVIPPNTIMTLAGGALQLAPRSEIRGQHLPIDHFFKSLAESRQSAAIGVILSGNGSDGSVGLEEIKAAGGITFVQDETAAFGGMPQSARGSGCVDFVLPPDEIARELARIGRHPYMSPPDGDRAGARGGKAAPTTEGDDPFRNILGLLRSSFGVDFGAYRDTTVQRRIRRRMVLHRKDHPIDYLGHLQSDRAELDALYHDILINVTSFFRGPEAFETLKQSVFPEILKTKTPATPIRFWVPGCSTGQEAYSLAMVLLEFLDDRPFRPPIQIFATDLSDAVSLQRARDGEYPTNIEAEISPERLRRFFSKQNDRYRIDKGIRDLCVFAKQNVAADPPFSRMDLISCRNLLIYLSPLLQRRVIPTFHYALNPGGFLLLGASESVGAFSDLFSVVDLRHRIYLKNPSAGRQYPHFSTQTALGLPASGGRSSAPPTSSVDWQREADRLALGHYAPPGVLVNDALEVLQFRGQTSPYLAHAPGEPSFNLLKMTREGLLFELRAVLAECRERNAPVRRAGVRVVSDGLAREIDLQVIPVTLPGTSERCFLVQFEPSRPAPESGAERSAASIPTSTTDTGGAATASEREATSLRHELTSTREYLQSVIEQQEAAHEELRSANEEVLSANEELQSTNEELETAKEELQSVNEELTTVNEQLQTRNAELSRLDDDATNLFTSANVPMVVVGIDLRVRRYTPAAAKLLGLAPTDVGRPLTTLPLIVEIADLETEIVSVIETVQIHEREVRGRDGREYALRIHPYRTMDKRIAGAVIVFVDVDDLSRAQAQLTLARNHVQAIVDTIWEPLVVLDSDGRVVSANRPFYQMFQVTSGETEARLLFELAGGRWDVPELRRQLEELEAHGAEIRELEAVVEIEGLGRRILLLNARRIATAPEGPQHVLLAFDDVTERRQMEAGLRLQRDELVSAGYRKDEFLAMLAHELRNPLGPMSAAVQILRLTSHATPEAQQAWGIMDRQVHHMTRLIDDLLDVSRITSGKIELRRERVDLRVAVNIIVGGLRPRVDAARLDLIVALPEEPMIVQADPVRLGQIIENFLTNAIKYTDPGGRIELSAELQGDDAVVRIRDNGIGIAPELLPNIWDPFVQAEPSGARSRTGLGIGLTLVRRIVDLHGGTVEARSEGLGRGSEFIVRLPRAHQQVAAAPEVTPDAGQPSAAAAPRRTVLVVEDNRDAAISMQMLLQLMGHEARVANNGRDALGFAIAHRFDLIFLDIGLPDIDGYEVARRLREELALTDVVLVALSGHGGNEDRRRSRDVGIDAHVVKPITRDVLTKLLKELPARPRS